MMRRLIELYKKWCGKTPVIGRLQGSGSNRQYFRLTDDTGQSVIGVIGTDREENEAFIYLTGHFTRRRLSVPHIIAVSDDRMCYLQTDLGHLSLYDAIAGGRNSGGRYTLEEKRLLVNTIRALPDIQIRGARELDFSH